MTTENDEPSTPQNIEAQGKIFDFIPEIKFDPVINGVLQLKITSINTLWINNQFHAFNDTCFNLFYRRINSQNRPNHHIDVDNIWRTQFIPVGSVGDDGTMYFKMKVFLYNYDFEFRLQTMNVTNNKWMTSSKIYTVNIPSFLKDENFNIGQRISFRNTNTFSTTDGEIMEILPDNMFKIKYLKYDSKKHGPRNFRSSYIETYNNIHLSRMYHKSTHMQYEIDLINTDSMDKNLLIQSENEHKINCFKALKNSLKKLCKIECDMTYGKERAIINWKGMNRFISKNIYDFLYNSDYKYSIDCIIDSFNDHRMNMINLRQSDIRTKYELLKMNIGNIISSVYQHENVWYGCDFCRCSIKEWDFVFQCTPNSYLNRHDYCVHCINSIITLNGELSNLLNELLVHQLISDCVKVIVDYVIGGVVLVKYNDNGMDNEDVIMDNKYEKCNKRKLNDNDVLFPIAKKRKLNVL
eukprot:440119_1